MIIHLLLLLLLCASQAMGAVSINTTTSSNTAGATETSLTFNHTNVIGDFLVCTVSTGCVTACPSGTTTATFNGDSLTLYSTVDAPQLRSQWFYRVNPDVITNGSVVITLVGTDNVQRFTAGCTNLTGVDQASPVGTAVTSQNGATSSRSCTATVPAGGAVVAVFGSRDSTSPLTTTTGINLWTNVTTNAVPANNREGAGSYSVTAGGQNMTATDADVDDMTCIAVPINAAVGGAASKGFPLWFR